jgi:hypothetical protein
VTIAMVLPPGAVADRTSLARLTSAVEGEVSSYWSGQTGGRLAYTVTKAVGWLRVTASCADPWALWQEVARRTSFAAGPGRHLAVFLPAATPGCYAGLATVGTGPDSGGSLYVRGSTPGLIAHELGHNAGLGHSGALQCDATSDGRWSVGWTPVCSRDEYRDWYDVMGASWDRLGSLSTAHAHRLGVLPAAAVRTVAGPAVVTLTALGRQTGLRSLRIADPQGGTYVVEYRAAVGLDAWLADNWRGLRPGVLVRRPDPVDGTRTLLLDGTPSAQPGFADDWNVPVPPGGILTTGSGRVVLRVDAVTPEQATVTVAVDGVWPGPELARLGARQAAPGSSRISRAPAVQEVGTGDRRERRTRPRPAP